MRTRSSKHQSPLAAKSDLDAVQKAIKTTRRKSAVARLQATPKRTPRQQKKDGEDEVSKKQGQSDQDDSEQSEDDEGESQEDLGGFFISTKPDGDPEDEGENEATESEDEGSDDDVEDDQEGSEDDVDLDEAAKTVPKKEEEEESSDEENDDDDSDDEDKENPPKKKIKLSSFSEKVEK